MSMPDYCLVLPQELRSVAKEMVDSIIEEVLQ